MLFSEFQRALVKVVSDSLALEPVWTAEILDECFRNLVRLGRITPAAAQIQQMQLRQLFPKALQAPACQYIADVKPVDEKDRHVAALALKLYHDHVFATGTAQTVWLLTWNIRDFPARPLRRLGIERLSPDEWLCGLIQSQPTKALLWLEQAAALMCELGKALGDERTSFQEKSPGIPDSADQWPAFLHRQWFKQSASTLKKCLASIH